MVHIIIMSLPSVVGPVMWVDNNVLVLVTRVKVYIVFDYYYVCKSSAEALQEPAIIFLLRHATHGNLDGAKQTQPAVSGVPGVPPAALLSSRQNIQHPILHSASWLNFLQDRFPFPALWNQPQQIRIESIQSRSRTYICLVFTAYLH